MSIDIYIQLYTCVYISIAIYPKRVEHQRNALFLFTYNSSMANVYIYTVLLDTAMKGGMQGRREEGKRREGMVKSYIRR